MQSGQNTNNMEWNNTTPANTTYLQQQPSSFTQGSTFQQQPLSQGTFQQQPLSQGTFQQQPLSQGTFQQQPLTQGTFGQQPLTQPAIFASHPSGDYLNYSNVPGTYIGNNTMTPAGGFGQQQQGLGGNTQLGNTLVSELELKKRMLDNDRETQLKYADMESDKQKKLEDKAEKHRVKAAKWKARHMEMMVRKHEKSSSKLEQKAHTHFMKAEDYKARAKEVERQRKQYDPPSDQKADAAKKPGDKKAGDKKDEKKEEKKEEKKDATESRPQMATKTSTDGTAKTTEGEKVPAPQQSNQQQSGQQQQSTQQSGQQPPVQQQQNQQYQDQQYQNQQQPQSVYSSFNQPNVTYDPDRPKRAPIVEKPDYDSRFQQDVSTAAIRNAKYNPAAEQAALQQQTGLGRS